MFLGNSKSFEIFWAWQSGYSCISPRVMVDTWLSLREFLERRVCRHSKPILYQLSPHTIGFCVWRLLQKLWGALGSDNHIPEFFQPLILGSRKYLVRPTYRHSKPILCQLSPGTIGFWLWRLVHKLWSALGPVPLFFEALMLTLKEHLVRRTHGRSRPNLCQHSHGTSGFWLWRLVQELGRALDPGSQIPDFFEALILTLREHLVRRTHGRSRPIICQLSHGTIGFQV